MKQGGKTGEIRFGANSIDVNAAIGFIARPAG
jgi:hypothetical protein